MQIHKKAIVETSDIGEGTRIWAFAHVMKNVKIGKNCNIGEGVFIEDGVILGDNVTVKNGVCLWTGVIVSNNVFIGPNAVFTNDQFPRNMNKLPISEYKQTFLQDGCSIGANSTIVAPVCIGRGALVGAGSVVTKNVEEYSIVYGNPARPNGKFICNCGFVDVKSRFLDHRCEIGSHYE